MYVYIKKFQRFAYIIMEAYKLEICRAGLQENLGQLLLLLQSLSRISSSSGKPQFCFYALSTGWIRSTHSTEDNLKSADCGC